MSPTAGAYAQSLSEYLALALIGTARVRIRLRVKLTTSLSVASVTHPLPEQQSARCAERLPAGWFRQSVDVSDAFPYCRPWIQQESSYHLTVSKANRHSGPGRRAHRNQSYISNDLHTLVGHLQNQQHCIGSYRQIRRVFKFSIHHRDCGAALWNRPDLDPAASFRPGCGASCAWVGTEDLPMRPWKPTAHLTGCSS
jgi:hypothetical protein